MTLMNRPLYLRRLATFAVAALIGASALGQAMAHHHGQSPAAKPPVFIASTAKPFAALTDDAMAVMDDGMKRAPMNGVAEHDFVTAAIVLWNTVYLERATQALREKGKLPDDGMLQFLSPLGWEHINLTGDYVWRQQRIAEGGFRELRKPQE